MTTAVNVQTAQNVEIEYSIAGVGDRILSTIVDGLVVVGWLIAAMTAIELISSLGVTEMMLVYLPVLFYHLICEVTMDGQSVGKRLLKIRVVRLDGTEPTFGNYIIRWITRLFEIGMFWGAPAVVAVLLSDKGQRLGDMAAGTCVVKLREVEIGSTIFQAIDENYQLVFPDVRKLNDEDIEIIKDVLRSFNSSGRTARSTKLVERAAGVVKSKMGVSTDSNNVSFLRTVVKDYNHYAGNLASEEW